MVAPSQLQVELRSQEPAVEHRDAAADVADRDRQIDGPVRHLGDPAAARDVEPLVVGETRPSAADPRAARASGPGRSPASSERSAALAARFADRTDAKVANASTRVAPAVAIDETATQSTASITPAPERLQRRPECLLARAAPARRDRRAARRARAQPASRKSRGRTSSVSSSQRSGVDTGAPGFGRTE